MNDLTDDQIQAAVFAVLRRWKDDRAWVRYTRESGPYDVSSLRPEVLEIIRAVLAAARTPETPRADPWRQAIDDALISHALDCTADSDDPATRVRQLVEWAAMIALAPAVSERAQALIDRGRASSPNGGSREAERIAVGFANFPAIDSGGEYDEPEVQPYAAILEGLQQRLVPFTNSKGVTLELFVEVRAASPVAGSAPDKQQALEDLALLVRLAATQKPLDPEIAAAVEGHRWDLYDRRKPAETDGVPGTSSTEGGSDGR